MKSTRVGRAFEDVAGPLIGIGARTGKSGARREVTPEFIHERAVGTPAIDKFEEEFTPCCLRAGRLAAGQVPCTVSNSFEKRYSSPCSA